MFRAILYLIGFLLFTGMLKSVLRIFTKFAGGASSGSATAQQNANPSPRSAGSLQGELKKDPTCGTFISTATAMQKVLAGQTYYFCSAACRDQFKG